MPKHKRNKIVLQNISILMYFQFDVVVCFMCVLYKLFCFSFLFMVIRNKYVKTVVIYDHFITVTISTVVVLSQKGENNFLSNLI